MSDNKSSTRVARDEFNANFSGGIIVVRAPHLNDDGTHFQISATDFDTIYHPQFFIRIAKSTLNGPHPFQPGINISHFTYSENYGFLINAVSGVYEVDFNLPTKKYYMKFNLVFQPQMSPIVISGDFTLHGD